MLYNNVVNQGKVVVFRSTCPLVSSTRTTLIIPQLAQIISDVDEAVFSRTRQGRGRLEFFEVRQRQRQRQQIRGRGNEAT
jgi:hypothetical protein